MKLKINFHQGADSGDWSREDDAALRFWNRIFTALAVVVVLASVVGLRAPTLELGAPVPSGFALWFLLCLAYPVLGIVGLFNLILGTQDSALMQFLVRDHQVMTVVIIDFLTLSGVWAAGRFWMLRRFGGRKLRIVANFATILLGWGIFQLLVFGILSIWHTGGFEPLHKNMRHDEPERVIVVNPATESGGKK